jgi:hypothetical protein
MVAIVVIIALRGKSMADGDPFAPIVDATEAVDRELDFKGIGLFAGVLVMRPMNGSTYGPMLGADYQRSVTSGVHFVGTYDLLFGYAGGFQYEARFGGGAAFDTRRFSIDVIGGGNAGGIGPAGALGLYAQLGAQLHLHQLIVSAAATHTRALIDSDEDRLDVRVTQPTASLFVGGQLHDFGPSRDVPNAGGGSALFFYIGARQF